MAVRINETEFEEKVLKADKPVLLDFYSDTCIPCKRMSGVIGEIEEDYQDKIYVYKVNVNYDSELAEKYQVMSAPTIIIFKDGEEQARKSGLAPKADIVELFSKLT